MTACRSCGAEIFWATTAAGRAMPIDPTPTPDGNVIIQRRDGRIGATVLAAGAAPASPQEPRYTSHFATCPNASSHRRR